MDAGKVIERFFEDLMEIARRDWRDFIDEEGWASVDIEAVIVRAFPNYETLLSDEEREIMMQYCAEHQMVDKLEEEVLDAANDYVKWERMSPMQKAGFKQSDFI